MIPIPLSSMLASMLLTSMAVDGAYRAAPWSSLKDWLDEIPRSVDGASSISQGHYSRFAHWAARGDPLTSKNNKPKFENNGKNMKKMAKKS